MSVVTCYLHFWQNDQHLLHATAVTGGWNWYRNKSQYRKLTLEKKILVLLLPGLKHKTFQPDILPQSYPCSPMHVSGCVCTSVYMWVDVCACLCACAQESCVHITQNVCLGLCICLWHALVTSALHVQCTQMHKVSVWVEIFHKHIDYMKKKKAFWLPWSHTFQGFEVSKC